MEKFHNVGREIEGIRHEIRKVLVGGVGGLVVYY